MTEDIEQKFNEAQAELIEKFKAKLKYAAEDVLSTIYTDVANHASTDAHTNYHNYLRDHFKESLIREITEEYTHYSWAHGIRIELLEKYPEKLKCKIIEDLQEKVKSLNEHIEQLRRFR